jgi:hypothetical protein
MNTLEALANVNKLIEELEGLNDRTYAENNGKVNYSRHKTIRYDYRTGKRKYAFYIGDIFDEVGIFDWWGDTLSVSQLKQMKAFLEQAHKLGFDGYVCFKVGAAGCSHGMWAHKEESTTGYSLDGDVLFHSFRSGDCYWDVCLNNTWIHDTVEDSRHNYKFSLKRVKEAIRG